MWQVVIEFYALENNFFDERSIQTCSLFSCCSLGSFQFKLDKFIFIITIKQAAGCNKIQLMCKWQLHAFLKNSEVTNHMSHTAWLMLNILNIGSEVPIFDSLISLPYASTSQKFIFEISTPMSHTFWTWWILVNFKKWWKWFWEWWFVVSTIALIVSFLTNWFELFWFIMLKDTRHPTYTSCVMIHVQSETSFFCLCNQHQPPDQRKFRENSSSWKNTIFDRTYSKIKILMGKLLIQKIFCQIIWIVTDLWDKRILRKRDLKDSKESSELGWSCMYT